jgi:arginase
MPRANETSVQAGSPAALISVAPVYGGVQALPPRKIKVIGVPLDLGASRRGVDMGPSAVRVAGLEARLEALGHEVRDSGNISVAIAETKSSGHQSARYLKEITDTCTRAAEMVLKSLAEGMTPVILGGDHSVAAGSVSGVAEFYRKQNQKIGLIWIDAHADMNTPESSPSGNIHGMPLACCVGLGPAELTRLAGYSPAVEPSSVAIIGLRSVDEIERLNVRETGVHAFTMRDIDERGMRAVIQEAIEFVTHGAGGFHLSFDMDAVDPGDAPGVGTPVRGGITYREAHLAMELVCDSGLMASMEVVEVNPVIDEANRTALLAVELVMSAMGKRIL